MPATDAREALAEQFYKSAVYRDLMAARTASLHGTGFNTPEAEAERLEIERRIREGAWSAANPGNTGRFRIGLRCDGGSVRPLDSLPSFNTPRFNTRKEANDWIATQTGAPAEMLAAWDAGESGERIAA